MIIGHRQPAVLGDTKPATAPVKNLQKTMILIDQLFGGKNKYAPTKNNKTILPTQATGKVGKTTASGLYLISTEGVAQIPGISAIFDLMPNLTRNRDVFEAVWKGIEASRPEWHQENLVDPIRNAAASVDSILKVTAQGASGPTGIRSLAIKRFPGGITQITTPYPEGTVAVRDPILGKFRLLAPVR